jgi:NAD(P)H-nitrite reductase large subunit
MTSEPKKIPGLIPQKDGSYAFTVECPQSFFPPEILEAVAAVAREHGAMVHPTTGQKLMILNMPMDTAAKAMASLERAGAFIRRSPVSHPRTCIGTPFCKFALQDTVSVARQLYDEFGKVLTPPKMKVAVSGCPACCSWANIIDVGFVGVKSGYKVFVGGHGGALPQIGQEIGSVIDAEEAASVLRRALELFLAEVKKKARFSTIIKNLGLDEVKRRLGF